MPGAFFCPGEGGLDAIHTATDTNNKPTTAGHAGNCRNTTAPTTKEVAGSNAFNNANVGASIQLIMTCSMEYGTTVDKNATPTTVQKICADSNADKKSPATTGKYTSEPVAVAIESEVRPDLALAIRRPMRI